jgi:type III pantothenate kinase
MLLAIDVGNSNIVLGVFAGDQLLESWRLATIRERTVDEMGLLMDALFRHSRIERVAVHSIILGSVVPPLTGTIQEMSRRYFGVIPLTIEPGTKTGMPILYEQPSEVGADRIVNGVAAYEKYGRSAGNSVIVVDFGTATTFDAITAKGEYLGGAICPGVQISADALFARAARLPRIDVRKPSQVIGRTTIGAMEAGLFYGYVGLVEGLVRRMAAELDGLSPEEQRAPGNARGAKCVATGGLAATIAPETSVIDEVDPDLTLHGLRIVWERNQR